MDAPPISTRNLTITKGEMGVAGKNWKVGIATSAVAAGLLAPQAASAQAFYLQEQSSRGAGRAFSGEVAEAALAHTIGDKVEAAYRRGDALEKRRELMAAWCAFVESGAQHDQQK